MKALEIVTPGEIWVVDRMEPVLEKGEVLLKISHVGFCGSDLSSFMGKNPLVDYPRIPGYEISAVIEQLGDEVPQQLKKGQKVTVVPYTNCGQCAACRQKFFYLQNVKSEKYIDIEGGKTDDGANVLQWSLTNASNQKWILSKVDMTTSVNDELAGDVEPFRIYPNPVYNYLTIKSSKGAIVKLYNLVGKVVMQSVIEAGEQGIDMSGFESGIYLIEVDQDGYKTTKKLIKK